MSSPTSERYLPNNAALGFLEYIFFSHKQDVERSADLVTLALHATLLSRDLQLVGDTGQMLPQNWAKSDPVRLRYYKPQTNDHGEKLNVPPTEKEVILLCVTETTPNIIMSISTGSKCVGHSVKISETIQGTWHTAKQKSRYEAAFVDAASLIVELESHFIHPLFKRSLAILSSSSSKDNSEEMIAVLADETRRTQPKPTPRGSGGRQIPGPGARDPSFRPPPSYDYGRRDLDPFAVGPGPGFGGGGMLLDPRHSGPLSVGPPDPHSGVPLPPGAVPPHARFDPFMPPGMGGARPMPRGPGFPDPDAPGPLGYEDMYM